MLLLRLAQHNKEERDLNKMQKTAKKLPTARLDDLTDAQTLRIAKAAYADLPPAQQARADRLIAAATAAQEAHLHAEGNYNESFQKMHRAYKQLSVALGLQPNFLF